MKKNFFDVLFLMFLVDNIPKIFNFLLTFSSSKVSPESPAGEGRQWNGSKWANQRPPPFAADLLAKEVFNFWKNYIEKKLLKN